MEKIVISDGTHQVSLSAGEGFAAVLRKCFPFNGKQLQANTIFHSSKGLHLVGPFYEIVYVPKRWPEFSALVKFMLRPNNIALDAWFATAHPIQIVRAYNAVTTKIDAAESLARIAAKQWSFHDAMRIFPHVTESQKFQAALTEAAGSNQLQRKRGRQPKQRQTPDQAEALVEFVHLYHFIKEKPLDAAIDAAIQNHGHIVPHTWQADPHESLRKLLYRKKKPEPATIFRITTFEEKADGSCVSITEVLPVTRNAENF